jgi:hypothetical protein
MLGLVEGPQFNIPPPVYIIFLVQKIELLLRFFHAKFNYLLSVTLEQ